MSASSLDRKSLRSGSLLYQKIQSSLVKLGAWPASAGRVPAGPSLPASEEARLLTTRLQTHSRSAARHLLYEVRTGSSSGSRGDDRKLSAIVSRRHLMPHRSAKAKKLV